MAVFFLNVVYSRGVSIPRGQSYRRPICIYYFLGSTGTQRCRLPVDPRGSAATVTGRSQRARIRSGIFDFRSVNLIQIRSKEPAPLFENNIDIYREVSKDTVTRAASIIPQKDGDLWIHLFGVGAKKTDPTAI